MTPPRPSNPWRAGMVWLIPTEEWGTVVNSDGMGRVAVRTSTGGMWWYETDIWRPGNPWPPST